MNFTRNALCFAVTLLLAAAVPAIHAAYGVGDRVDEFTLNDAYGNPVSLYDYQGMAVLLNFWQPG